METNNHTEKNTDMKDNILTKITDKEVSMRPKMYFTTKFVVLCSLVVFILLLSIFVVSIIFFSLRVSGHALLFGFGFQGVILFLKLFPWIPLAVDIVAIFLLAKLLRKFTFVYRRPLLPLLVLVFVLCVGTGLLIDRATDLNDTLLDNANHNKLPKPFSSVYEGANRLSRPRSWVCRCQVVSIGTDTMIVVDTKLGFENTFTVFLPDDLPVGSVIPFSVGDLLYIAGPPHDGVIHPIGIRALEPDGQMMFAPQ